MRLYNVTKDLHPVGGVARHSSLNTTAQYAKRDIEDHEDVMDQADG